MKKKMIIAGVSVIVAVLISTLLYLNSDLRVSRLLEDTDGLVTLEGTTFRVSTTYTQGQAITRIESATADTENYGFYSGWLNEEDSVITVSYIDKNRYPVYSVPFSKGNIITENGNLRATKVSKMPKSCALSINSFYLNARRIIIKE